jgi:hypothetical protein
MKRLFFTIIFFGLLLTACQPASTATPTAPVQATAAPTQAPVQATPSPAATGKEISIDLSGLAQSMTVETIAAVPAGDDHPYWEAGPEHLQVTLAGYPVNDHLMKAQIFIYPVDKFSEFNQAAGQIAGDLPALLKSHEAVDVMPFLPLFNAMQVMHAQVQYLDFKNGSGVRFLTQFDQAPLPINNYELIYTFQGLTSDGKYYVAAVLPVSQPELPANEKVNDEMAARMSDFPAYLTETVTWLEKQPANSFTPDLAALDGLINSIEVK